MPKLIGFTGLAGSGKTTAANILRDLLSNEKRARLVVVKSFAGPLKDCLLTLFDFEYEQLYTMEGKETIDERYGVTPRLIMQRFGTEFIRTTVPNLWEILMEENIVRCGDSETGIIIDDVRFEPEADLIRSMGGRVVHIKGRGGIDSDHESEAGLKIKDQDFTINNKGDMDLLRLNLARLC